MNNTHQASLDIPFSARRMVQHLEDSHVRLNVTAKGPPTYKYSLAVPKTWAYSKEFGPVPSGPFATRGIGFVAGSYEPGAPVIAVTVTPVPYEIPIDAWIRRVLAADAWDVVSAKWFAGKTSFFDVVATRVSGRVVEVRRTSVRADGHNVFAVNTVCERKHWDQAKEIFWVAHDSFRVENGTGTAQMEPWEVAGAADPDFQLAYPRTWSAESQRAGGDEISAVHLRLIAPAGKTLLAYVQAKVERLAEGAKAAALDHLAATTLEKLRRTGFVPRGAPRPMTADEDPRALVVQGWRGGFVASGHLGTSDVVCRMGFLARLGCSITILMVSPLADADPLSALRAQRAFEIAHDTIEIE